MIRVVWSISSNGWPNSLTNTVDNKSGPCTTNRQDLIVRSVEQQLQAAVRWLAH